MNEGPYLCIIDYIKAFEAVRNTDMMKMLADLHKVPVSWLVTFMNVHLILQDEQQQDITLICQEHKEIDKSIIICY